MHQFAPTLAHDTSDGPHVIWGVDADGEDDIRVAPCCRALVAAEQARRERTTLGTRERG